MSIRIHNDQATDIAASQAGRSDLSPASGTSAQSRIGGGQSGTGGDRVEVSSITESISAGITNNNLDRANRVAQLSSLYANGRYDADAGRLSQALVANAISATSAGKA